MDMIIAEELNQENMDEFDLDIFAANQKSETMEKGHIQNSYLNTSTA